MIAPTGPADVNVKLAAGSGVIRHHQSYSEVNISVGTESTFVSFNM